MKRLFAIVLLAASFAAACPLWAADPTDTYLAELQGSLRDVTKEALAKAPGRIRIGEFTFKLEPSVYANLMPAIGNHPRGLNIYLTVAETLRKNVPVGTSLDHLWLVRTTPQGAIEVWHRDLRQVPEVPMTCRWYTLEKQISDGPISWATAETLKVVAGVTTPAGKLLLVGATANIDKAY